MGSMVALLPCMTAPWVGPPLRALWHHRRMATRLLLRIRTTHWYRCASCGDAHPSAAEHARHHCAHPVPGADEHGHCRLCGFRVTVRHLCAPARRTRAGRRAA